MSPAAVTFAERLAAFTCLLSLAGGELPRDESVRWDRTLIPLWLELDTRERWALGRGHSWGFAAVDDSRSLVSSW